MSDRQDIYSGQAIEWRWVLLGVLIVLGSQSLIAVVMAAIGVDPSSIGALLLATIIAFVLGGAVIGFLSPGYTTWEAGFASFLAAVASVVLAMRLLSHPGGLLSLVPIVLGGGLLCGLAGGWIGERLQSSTRGRDGQ